MHYLGQLPDLPLPHLGTRFHTRRKPLAHIVLCQGCCCGQTERGLPAVPLEWLKPIWKQERLNKVVQLTVSGCLGPCDLPNVCSIVTPEDQTWYGRLTTREDYAVLLNWARRCRQQGELVPLPQELAHLRFERWPGPDDVAALHTIEQEPSDLVLLSAADTEVLAWSAAATELPAGGSTVRALHLDRLRERRVFEAYLDDVVQESRLVLVRFLGGLGYWREQAEALHLLARAHGIPFVCLPGDDQPDPALAALNTVPLAAADTALRYCAAGGSGNARQLLHYLSDTFLGTGLGFAPPAALPEVGLYHPDQRGHLDLAEWRRLHQRTDRPTVGLVFYRAHWTAGNLAAVDALVRGLEVRGLNVAAVFAPTLAAALADSVLPPLDLLLTTTSFALSTSTTPTAALPDVPVLQAIFCSSSENVWAANIAGLAPRDVAMNVALPEFDGRIITTAISFKSDVHHDRTLQTDVVRYMPRADRVAHVASLAANWARLRYTPRPQKRLAILLANYPSKNARVGNAVGLDTPASLHRLLLALRDAGYDLSPNLPSDGQTLIEAIIAASVQDAEFATAAAHTRSPGWVTCEQYEQWLTCVPEAAEVVRRRWGGPEASPLFHDGGFPVPGLLLGNVFIGVQPSRGYDLDPTAVYHSPDLPPPPFYLAFYGWLRHGFGAHAVIHLGKHGNLEWLPGKSVALAAACFPEVALGDLPNLYPYIINNPGEGTQAKRRSAAVVVDHLIPPMTNAGAHGDLRELELLLDEYYAVQSLDPAKAPLLLAQIGACVAESRLYRDFECEEPPTAEELPEFLGRVDGYLCEIKESQIRDGLHILGETPFGERLVDLLLALVGTDQGDVWALPRALAHEEAANGSERHREDRVRERCQQLLRHLVAGAALESQLGPQTARCLAFVRDFVLPRLRRCPDEIAHLLHALDGRAVPPGPSGAPSRGRADVLPTGRNFYSLDVRGVPTPTAWRVGQAAADALLERHRERTGSYPESVALVAWGTSNMRTGGDDIAEVLWLLGVKPRWDTENRRVVGLEAVSLLELGRPRIDVTVRISGLFRDAFPHLVRLLNDATALAARLEEPLDRNFVRAHVARDTARLVHGPNGLVPEEAERLARLRVFGSKPGAYGAGLLPLIDGRNWRTADDLADVYLTWGSYAYTGSGSDDGHEEREAFRLRLASTDVVAQNQDNREHDLFDSDDYFQYHGGTVAAVRALAGRAPDAYLGDTSRPEAVRMRTLREEACRVFRSRVVNPRWLRGVMRHGYKGAVEMAATVDYLFGYDATTGVVDDWMYEKLAQVYLLDAEVRDFLRRVNPWAERAMLERLLEAAERGLWERPEVATFAALREQYGEGEALLEGRG